MRGSFEKMERPLCSPSELAIWACSMTSGYLILVNGHCDRQGSVHLTACVLCSGGVLNKVKTVCESARDLCWACSYQRVFTLELTPSSMQVWFVSCGSAS